MQLEAVETEASLWENEKFIEAIRFPASRYSNKSLTRMLRSLQYSKALCDEADIRCELDILVRVLCAYGTYCYLTKTTHCSFECSEYTKLKARALSLYGSTSACVTGVGCLTGETQFDTQMQKHSDYDTLLRIWTAWYCTCKYNTIQYSTVLHDDTNQLLLDSNSNHEEDSVNRLNSYLSCHVTL